MEQATFKSAIMVRQDYYVAEYHTTVPAGTLGWIHGVTDDGSALFQYLHPPPGGQRSTFILPSDYLEPGAFMRDPPPIAANSVPAQAPRPITAASVHGPSHNVLHATLRTLWNTIVENRETILTQYPGISGQSRKLLMDDHAAAYGDAVYKCISPSAVNIMANGEFDPTSLDTLDPVSTHWPPKSKIGVYIILYQHCDVVRIDGHPFTSAIYVGQTTKFQMRDCYHLRDQKEKKSSNHYRVARSAEFRRMIPIIFQADTNMPRNFLDIAEFTMVCLFDSWYFILTRPTDNRDLLSGFKADMDAAMLFRSIFREAAQRINWHPVKLYGLNWDTPIVNIQEPAVKFVGHYDNARLMKVFKVPRRVIVAAGRKTYVSIHKHLQIVIDKQAAEDLKGVNHGEMVQLVIEVAMSPDGTLQAHPFRYIRYPPDIGRNPEVEKVKALAVRIEWIPRGEEQWNSLYLDRGHLWERVQSSPEIPAAMRRGVELMMIVNNTMYSNPKPDWVPTGMDHPSIDIKWLRYHHLTQDCTVETIPRRVIPWPADRTVDENAERLRRMFPAWKYPYIYVGPRPDPQPQGFSRRVKCDICAGIWDGPRCVIVQGRSCDKCMTMNRPCTFTFTHDFRARMTQTSELEELGLATSMSYRTHENAIMDMPPPFDAGLLEDCGALEDGKDEN